MCAAKDTAKTCLGLFALTWVTVSIPGCLGGALYIVERPDLQRKAIDVGPLTSEEINLMNRLRESVNMEKLGDIDKSDFDIIE